MKIHSYLAAVPCTRAAGQRQSWRGAFDDDAWSNLTDAPLHTVAGMVAAKQALWGLRGFFSSVNFDARDFHLTRTAEGKPQVTRHPPLNAGCRLAISITHTRKTAYGLAVIEEPSGA